LSVIVIEVPGLNDRKDDIPALAEHFLNNVASEYGAAQKSLSLAPLLPCKITIGQETSASSAM
jgi:DNA-binding NtrC family response regulator